MIVKIVEGSRHTVAFEIGGAREGPFLRQAEPANDQVTVGDFAAADDTIIALAHDVDETVAFADVERKRGMARHERRQVRKDERARHRAVHLDAQQPSHLVARQCRFGILDLGKDSFGALIVDLAFQRRRDVAGGPLQQADADPFFELLDRRGRGRARNAEVGRRGAEALPLHHPDQQAHAVEFVHCSSFLEFICTEI